MELTAFFRHEQRLLNAVADQLHSADPAQFGANRAFELMSLLDDRLQQHVHAQSAQLAPCLLRHADAAVRVRALAFAAQTSAFMRFFRAFIARWPTRAALTDAPTAFLADADVVLNALRAHVRDEELSLYDMIDELGQSIQGCGVTACAGERP